MTWQDMIKFNDLYSRDLSDKESDKRAEADIKIKGQFFEEIQEMMEEYENNKEIHTALQKAAKLMKEDLRFWKENSAKK